MYLQKVISRKTFFFNLFFVVVLKSLTKIEESGSISQRYESADTDPSQNFMDPQHWFLHWNVHIINVSISDT
jgi:hypothetical protein